MKKTTSYRHVRDTRTSVNVLMVAPHPCFEARGTPINVQLMCRVLTDLGFEIHLATYPIGATVPISGLVYHRVRKLPFLHRIPIGFSIGKIIYDLLLVGITVRLLSGHRFVAVHAVEESAFFVMPLARLFRVPAIIDLDSDICDQLQNHRSAFARSLVYLARPLQRWAIRWSTCALTVCQSLTEHVQRICPEKVVFQIEDVPLPSAGSMPDMAKASKLRRELGIEGRRVILYSGNLEPYQGVDLLVDSLPVVVRQHADIALVIVGGEEEQIAELRKRGRSLGVSSILHLIGKRDPEMMPELMALADVLVSPRCEGENTPMKVYTYMLSGRPIVATRLPTHTQVLNEQTAILTPPTPAGIADGLVRALDNPKEVAYLGLRAKEKVQRKHSYERFAGKLGEVYAYITRASRPACRPRRSGYSR